MIPQTIHYCWFGGKKKPACAEKCIRSWRKYLPDHEIVEWNETNFDVDGIPFTKEAYAAGKFAFVSDYARFKILFENGGIYFDTDVEVIKSFDDIVSQGAFMGCERYDDGNSSDNEILYCVNPGLGMGAVRHMEAYRAVLDFYEALPGWNRSGDIHDCIVGVIVTDIMKAAGFDPRCYSVQKCRDITFYPSEYFAPRDSLSAQLRLTEKSHSIHHYQATWMSPRARRDAILWRWLLAHPHIHCLLRFFNRLWKIGV
ncbi:MAG: glycosyl transferase [Lentisphaeria bacterium]|nr:glycosyl transferase [Lentisphaeria bacterium]